MSMLGVDVVKGSIGDLLEKLAGENGEEYLAEFKRFLRKEKCWHGGEEDIPESALLECISRDKSPIIGACRGNRTLIGATKTFQYVDPDILERCSVGEPTEETVLCVSRVMKPTTPEEVFESFGKDFRDLSLTQEQILVFCEKHYNWMVGADISFFLHQGKEGKFSMVIVCHGERAMIVCSDRFKKLGTSSQIGISGYSGVHNVVVPQRVFPK